MNKPFVYLVQARHNLPWFKRLSTNDSDCFVLNFKEQIPGKFNIYFPNSTWTTGRNKLLEVAFQHAPYEYFIFLDDDARLVHKLRGDINTKHYFEQFLMDYKPALGFSDYEWHVSENRKDHHDQGIRHPLTYDACLNAYHRNALHCMLPYEDCFDHYSWHHSQEFQFHLGWMFYPDKIVQLNDLFTRNRMSDPYPREGHFQEMYMFFKGSLLPTYQAKWPGQVAFYGPDDPYFDPDTFHPGYWDSRHMELLIEHYDRNTPTDRSSLIPQYANLNHQLWNKRFQFWKQLGWPIGA